MARVRARRGHTRRDDWPLTVEAEVASGIIDTTPFRSVLARIYARQAARALVSTPVDPEYALVRLTRARDHEALHRSLHPDEVAP